MKYKIAILTSHLLCSAKKANIHIIYELLVKNNHDVDFITYPVSLSFFAKRNRYKIVAFFRGFFKQRFLFTFFQSSPKLKKFLPEFMFDKLLNRNKIKYDILICEGGSSSVVFENMKYEKLIYRMSDHPDYCNFSDKIYKYEDILANKADLILSVLKNNLHSELKTFKYLPNPSIYNEIIENNNKLNECVYVGSNKINNNVVFQLAQKGVKIHIYSEDIKINHENIIFHNLVPKEQLVSKISKYRIGLIPFNINDQNKHMEIPLKTYDYLASGLEVFMLTPSDTIKSEIMHVYRDEKEYIRSILSYIDSDKIINVKKYNNFIRNNSLDRFSININNYLSEICD